MRFVTLILLVFIPILLMAQCPFQSFNGQNSLISSDRDGQRAWQPSTIETGDWDFDDFNYERDWKSEFVYSVEHPTVPIQIKGFAGYDHVGFQWLPKSYFNYTYNDDFSRILQVVFQDSVDNQPIQTISRYSYQYDDQNRLTVINTDLYQNPTWTPFKHLHLTYNNGYLTETVESAIYDSYVNYIRFTYEYDGLGKLITKQKYQNQDTLVWYASNKLQYTYQPNDTTTNDGFINYYSTTYPFIYPLVENSIYGFSSDYYGMVSLITDGLVFGVNYVPVNRNTYTYNNYGQLTEGLTEDYNSTVPIWQNRFKFTLTYDLDANPEYKYTTAWNSSTTSWENERRITFSWLDPTPTDDQVAPAISDLNLKAYPNPFQNQFQVNVSTKGVQPVVFEVFNIKGQCVQKLSGQSNSAICFDSSKLSNGVYLLKATQGKITETSKIVKVK